MPDHIHAPPVCGYAPHSPHAPSCGGFTGRMIACGTITDPGHPNAGQCLCRHEEAKVIQAQGAIPMISSPSPAPAPAPAPAAAAARPAKITKMPRAKKKKAAKKKRAGKKPAKKKAGKKKKGRRK